MRRELLLLREMTAAAERICELIGELDVEELRQDSIRREAVLWNFTILGEAAGQVPPEIRQAHPSVEWANAIRLRNRIVHGYWEVDLSILHGTAMENLPAMIVQLRESLDLLEHD